MSVNGAAHFALQLMQILCNSTPQLNGLLFKTGYDKGNNIYSFLQSGELFGTRYPRKDSSLSCKPAVLLHYLMHVTLAQQPCRALASCKVGQALPLLDLSQMLRFHLKLHVRVSPIRQPAYSGPKDHYVPI